MGRKQLAMIATACAGVAIIFTFFGWVSGPDAVLEQFERFLGSTNGFGDQANGVFPFILALVALAGTVLVFTGNTKLVPLDGRQILFLACACMALAGLIVLISPLSGNLSKIDKQFGRSFAPWVVAIANLAGAAACFLATMKKGGGTKTAAAPAADGTASSDVAKSD